jgi:hypothetical protein
MLTANFKTANSNPCSIAISLGVPASYRGLRYAPLHPTKAMLRIKDHEHYRQAYQAGILDRLDPARVWRELHALAENPILLCWEDANVFCHRRIVAEWLEQNLGVKISELGLQREQCLPAMDCPAKKPSNRWAKKKPQSESFVWGVGDPVTIEKNTSIPLQLAAQPHRKRVSSTPPDDRSAG